MSDITDLNTNNHDTYQPWELIEAIRRDIMGELEAINQYNFHINHTANKKARAVWEDIKDEERVHVGELLTLLGTLCPSELDKLQQGEEEVRKLLSNL